MVVYVYCMIQEAWNSYGAVAASAFITFCKVRKGFWMARVVALARLVDELLL